jgi:hypothetical protein
MVRRASWMPKRFSCESIAETVPVMGAHLDLLFPIRLFIVPASRHYLSCIYMDATRILLAYANGKARAWNLQNLEFRRSTGFDSAQEMLAEGSWVEM